MSIEVANTIRAQINATDKAALWAYGAEQFTAIDADSYQSKYFNEILDWQGYRQNAWRRHRGGLAFLSINIRAACPSF